MKSPTFALVAFALTLSTLFSPALAAADNQGSGPDTARSITGTVTGTLAHPQTFWYQFAGDGVSPIGVTLDYGAPDGSHPSGVFFNVDWATADGSPNADWPGLYRYDRSSTYNLPPGVQYWTRSTSAQATYYVEVVNNSGMPVSYALALTGATFPPPGLSFSPSNSAPTPPSPAPTAAAPTAPAPTATATPTTSANTATDRSGLVLDPTVDVSGAFSTINVHIDSNSPNAAVVYRLMVHPPDGAVVDAVVPSDTRPEDGIAWYLNQLVYQGTPLSSYMVRVYGPANGAVVEADWSTSTDKGVLLVTISGAPTPTSVGP